MHLSLYSILFALCIILTSCYQSDDCLSTPYERVGRVSDHPIHDVYYGHMNSGNQSAFVMIADQLDDEVHKRWLESDHLHSCSEAEFHDRPDLERGFFEVYAEHNHGLTTSDVINAKHAYPSINMNVNKPPASLFTRAFFVAFREVNEEIFDTLKNNLLEASPFHMNNNTNQQQQEDVCYILASWIDKGYHFGDLHTQIQYGKQKNKGLSKWHSDMENGLLQLTVTLRGNRALHSKIIQSPPQSNSTILPHRPPKNQEREQTIVEIVEKQNPRDVYISSTTLFRHAVQFFDADYDERSIVIHARILYTIEELQHFINVRTEESWDNLTSILAHTLSIAEVQLPSLGQVEYQLLRLQQQQ